MFIFYTRLLFFFLILLPFTSLPSEDIPLSVVTTEGLPSNIVNQSVCVITGSYIDYEVDAFLPGPEPLIFSRSYSSLHSKGLLGNWCSNHREAIWLKKGYENGHQTLCFLLAQPSGSIFYYKGLYPTHKNKSYTFQLVHPKGLTNGATGEISGKSNIKNQKIVLLPDLEIVETTTGAGHVRTFKRLTKSKEDGRVILCQVSERKANGNGLLYKYGKKSVTINRVEALNLSTHSLYSWVNLSFPKHHCLLQTSNGKSVLYKFMEHKYHVSTKEFGHEDIGSLHGYYLTQVERSDRPSLSYDYCHKHNPNQLHICCKNLPEDRFLSTEYYCKGKNEMGELGNIEITDEQDFRLDRVKLQLAPVSHDTTPIITYRFLYHANMKSQDKKPPEVLDGHTEIFDAYHHKTNYFYNKEHRLQSIEKFAGTYPSYDLYSQDFYVWGDAGTLDEGNLVGKYLKEANGHLYSARYFTYDERGNILIDRLYGRLTGEQTPSIILDEHQRPIANGCEVYQKHFTYSNEGFNLLLSEQEEDGKLTSYVYYPGTDLLASQFLSHQNQIYLREFYTYDQNKVLIKKIKDDGHTQQEHDLAGVTERHITSIIPRLSAPIDLPEWEEEKYLDLATGQEILLKKVHSIYSPEGWLLQQDHYDSQGSHRYSLCWEYDHHGNIIKEVDPLGQTIIKRYDQNDNLIFKQGPSSDCYTQYTYDFSNRLVREDEFHLDGSHWAISYRYDYLGNRIATINRYGLETSYTYDEWGRPIAVCYPIISDELGKPLQPTTKTQYDVADHPICQIDLKGGKTVTIYNTRGEPTHIIYPDGTEEKFTYKLEGTLSSKIEKNGRKIRYSHDYQGRVLKEEIYSADQHLFKWTSFHYNTFHLLSSVDPEGLVTSYTYDSAGRLASVTQQDLIQTYIYDELGRVIQIREGEESQLGQFRLYTKEYDLLDRVIEERIEGDEGKVLQLIRYTYDNQGQRTLVQDGENITRTEYNSEGKPIKISDALGNCTHLNYQYDHLNQYHQYVLKTTITDPLGYQTIQIEDAANRLIEVSKINPFGTIISLKQFLYDVHGHQAQMTDMVIQKGKPDRWVNTVWRYNEGDQLIMLMEAAGTCEQKVTRYQYNVYGQKFSEVKPNGAYLFYTYDHEGRLETFRSSDHSFHYAYQYNRRDQPIHIIDYKNQCTNECVYDLKGQLIQEKLGNDLTVSYTYDVLGRIKEVTFPDGINHVEYIYGSIDLKQVRRCVKNTLCYTHTDLSHDLSGRVTQSQLVGQNGLATYQYDPLGRCIHLQTPHLDQNVPPEGYNPLNHLLCYQDQSSLCTFTYDDHDQLSREKSHMEHTYQCDSLSNRVAKDELSYELNALHQILRQGDKQYCYDANGNLTQVIQGDEVTFYTYDALNRLIEVNSNKTLTTYLYDSFNRRLAKKREGAKDQYFFYQGQEEIGVWEDDHITELKILGNGKKIRAIALELQGQVYMPIYDLFGNIRYLTDLSGQIVEGYRYTAFGEEEILNSEGQILSRSQIGNAWRYAGKRVDEETGLVFFGLRYYDSEVGRWISQDPLGFEDGPNLYAYLHHNPLAYFDAFGLYTTPLEASLITHKKFESGIFHSHPIKAGVKTFPLKIRQPEYSARYHLNQGFIDPKTGDVFNRPNLPDKRITFINGILNRFKDFFQSLIFLGDLAHINLHGVHSASYGILHDFLYYCQAAFHYIAYEAVRLLHEEWDDFFTNAPADATLLHFCSSRGVTDTRNALMCYPKELRARISVVAIAPGSYISKKLCKDVRHYVSKRDIIPYFDKIGRAMAKREGTIQILDPHSKAPLWDHPWQSPTYRPYIQKHINEYYRH